MKENGTRILALGIVVLILCAALPCRAMDEEGRVTAESVSAEGSTGGGQKIYSFSIDDEPIGYAVIDPEPMIEEEEISAFMEVLAATQPEEAAKLERLQKENPQEFERQLMDLISLRFSIAMQPKEEGVEYRLWRWHFPKEEIDEELRRLKKTDPERAKELEALREKDPKKFKVEFNKVRHGWGSKEKNDRRGPCGCRSLSFAQWLRQNYPEEAKELAELKERDPRLHKKRYTSYLQKYRKVYEASKDNAELAEILKEDLELKEQRDELLEQIGRLRTVCDESSTEETKAECEEKIILCREKMEEVLTKRFDLIVRRKEIEYEQLLEKLKKLAEQVEWRKSELENWRDPEFMKDNVKARLAELLGERDRFRWD